MAAEVTLDQWDVELGKRVQTLRNARAVSQTELARRVAAQGFSWHQATVYKIENALRPVRAKELGPFAGALRVPVDVLLGNIPLTWSDDLLATAAKSAEYVLGGYLGSAVECVLLDAAALPADPNIKELAHRITELAGFGGGR